MLYLSESDVRALLPMKEAIRLMRETFQALGRGEAQNQVRRRLGLAGGATLHSMAGACGRYFGTKVYSTHPAHGAWFLFLLYASETGRPLALFEANCLGQIRTGAVSGLATDLLARPEAQTLGVIGSGFQARSQVEAILAVRPIRCVKVWSRKPEGREAFAADCAQAFPVPVEAAASAEEAVRGSDIVVTATSSKAPVLEAGWVEAQAHVNAIGSNHPQRRELPPELLTRAELIAVDSLEAARTEAGDLLAGLDQWDLVYELGHLVDRPRTPGGISIFKSVGLGVEDVAAAGYIYERAVENWFGNRIPVFHSEAGS